MLEAITLDQLRTFIAAAEEGSFLAAGRKLRRAQSVVPTPSIGGAQRISPGRSAVGERSAFRSTVGTSEKIDR